MEIRRGSPATLAASTLRSTVRNPLANTTSVYSRPSGSATSKLPSAPVVTRKGVDCTRTSAPSDRHARLHINDDATEPRSFLGDKRQGREEDHRQQPARNGGTGGQQPGTRSACGHGTHAYCRCHTVVETEKAGSVTTTVRVLPISS